VVVAALLVATPAPAPVGATAASTTHSISGTVRNEAGAPLTGMTISTTINGADSTVPSVDVTATTTVSGTYTLAGLPPGDCIVRVEDPSGALPAGGYGASDFTANPGKMTAVTVADSDVTGIDILYPHLYTVSGSVTTADGTPLVGAGVVWEFQEGGCGTCEPWMYTAVTTTGTGGSFKLHLQPDDYALGFLPTKRAPRVVPDWAAWVVVAGDVTDLKVTLEPTSLIRGRIAGPKAGFAYRVLACGTTLWPPCEDWSPGIHGCDGIWDVAMATGGYVGYAIAVPAGKAILTFGGAENVSGDGSRGVLPGFWSGSVGLVPTAALATLLDLSHVDATGIDVQLQPLAIGIHAGSSAGGSFGRAPVTVAAGSTVTLRLGLPRAFAGMKVEMQAAALDAAGKPGEFRTITRRTVAAGGTVVWTTLTRRATAYRARYVPSAHLMFSPVLSAVVVAKVR